MQKLWKNCAIDFYTYGKIATIRPPTKGILLSWWIIMEKSFCQRKEESDKKITEYIV